MINGKWGLIPRPSILRMRDIFGKNLVKGAEIGVHRGHNAKSILKELNIDKLYLVDAWLNYEGIEWNRLNIVENYEFVLKLFKNNKRVEIIKDLSKNAIEFVNDNSLDFVYIDANHQYKYVRQDITLWSKKVKEGGIIAGHDIYNFSGILKAVMEICNKESYDFKIEIPDWYFIKTRVV